MKENNGWIDVKDRLPEEIRDYLVTDGSACMVLKFDGHKFDNYNGTIYWWDSSEVTHWQPLILPIKQTNINQ